jgi:hypothetical protein
VLHDGETYGKDIHFQKSSTDVKAHWTTCEDPESDVVKVTWCVGTTSGLCNIVEVRDLSPWIHNIHAVLDTPVQNGQKLYATVTATNGAGKSTKVTSDGVTVDNTPPKQGTVVVSNTTSGVKYLFGDDDIHAYWIDFEDKESGIEHYEVAICDARNLTNCPQPYTTVNNATHVQIAGKISLIIKLLKVI